MRFVYSHMTQTQLGQLFGTTSHKSGQWLKEIGLRSPDGTPTDMAHDDDYCKQAPSGQCGYHWVWNSQKTVAALREADYPMLPNPPPDLVRPAILDGPFCVRKSAGSEFVIENSDGSTSLCANNKMNADVVARILNSAHKTGVIDRLCQPQQLLQMPLATDRDISKVVTPFDERKEESPSKETTPHH